MYIGFSRLLVALCVVGLGFGAVFGAGVVYGRGQRPAAAIAAAPATPGAAGAAAAATGAGSGGQGGFGGAGAAGGAGAPAVNGVIDSATPTSIVVRQASGTAVTIAVNAQTVVRKNEVGTAQDLSAGTQVIVAPDAAMVATSVLIVAAGGSGGAGPGAGGRTGAGSSGTPGGNRAAGGAPDASVPAR